MPERTISVLYYTGLDGTVYDQGDTVDLSDEDAKRGDELGAFEGTGPFVGGTDITGTVTPPRGSALSDDEIDALSGDDLDREVEEAGIDASTGGSLADGSLSADEKRAALKEAQLSS
jgi:hypothetical protein